MAGLLAGGVGLATGWNARAQTTNTVREDEFRSRWANYQVDRPPTPLSAAPETTAVTSQSGVFGLFGKSLDQIFATGPFQIRATLDTGWEFSNENSRRPANHDRTDNSFYAAPTIGLFYNREFGPATLSLRYSAGYTYYLDHDYVGSSSNGGIFSQTAGLNLDVLGDRLTIHSITSASDGDGDDIESGQQRDRLAVGEVWGATYQLGELTSLGGSVSVDYTAYSGGTVESTETLSDSGKIYFEYAVTGKTRLRLEVGAGQDQQSSSDRSYQQTLVAANWAPTPKLTFDAGVGWGFQSNTGIEGRTASGSHPVYTFTAQYHPTEKLDASFHVGYEGVDVEPDLSLQLHWQPRLTTTIGLSVYQSSNLSTYLESQSLVTRGVLLSGQQRFFQRVSLSASVGVEQSGGYTTAASSSQTPGDEDPYYLGSISLQWEINEWLSFQTYYRGYTGRAGVVTEHEEGLRSRVSASFRITF